MPDEMEKLDIEKFNPTIADIRNIVESGKLITITDFTDKMQVKAVHDHRLQLKEIRVNITKQGKAFRQQALDFQKKVIAKEKELVALVEPEEERLSFLEEKADALEEREKRRDVLPKRLERLAVLNDGIEISGEEILDMDGSTFEGYFNKRIAEKNEKDRMANEVKERELKEAETKAAHDKEIKDAEERARADERKRAEEAEEKLKAERAREDEEHKKRVEREEREAKERADRTEREAKERADKIEREAKEKVEREERERKEIEEAKVKAEAEHKAKLSAHKKLQEFLASNGWTEEKDAEFYTRVVGNTVTLYKKVGEITL